MKRPIIFLLAVIITAVMASCGSSDDVVTIVKPRYHKTWPKKHRWHKKIKIWKLTLQMPERGGVKEVKMRR